MSLDSDSDLSRSSDYEFWKNLENHGSPAKIPTKSHMAVRNKHNLGSTEKEKYEKTIINIRDAKEEEINSLKIKIRNKTKKELFASVNELKIQYDTEAKRLQEDFAVNRATIQKKETEILRLTKIVIEQESQISALLTWFRKYKNKSKNPVIFNNSDTLKEEIDIVNHQLQMLKTVCEDFTKEIEYYRNKSEKLMEENQNLKRLYEEARQNIGFISNSDFKRVKQEKDDILNDFEKYKLETSKEIEAREVLNERQSKMIAALQDELKNAKFVLNSPRVKQRAFERFKEASEERLVDNTTGNSENLLPRFSKVANKKAAGTSSYKQWRSGRLEEARIGYCPLRTISFTPTVDVSQRRSVKISSTNVSRLRLSKNSYISAEADTWGS